MKKNYASNVSKFYDIVRLLEELHLRMSEEDFLKILLKSLLEIMPGFDQGTVTMKKGDHGIVVAAVGLPADVVGYSFKLSEFYNKFSSEPVVINNMLREVAMHQPEKVEEMKKIFKMEDVRKSIVTGIEAEGEIVGLFILDSKKEMEVKDEDFQILRAFSKLASIFTSMKLHQEKERNYQKEIIRAMIKAMEARDAYTVGHSERVALYSVEIAKKIGLSRDEVDEIYWGSMVHDLGKLSVPEHILLKPGPLSEKEYNIVKSHTIIGEYLIRDYKWLEPLKVVVRNHHERWDGKGYPDGLKKEEIPLKVRIVSIADSFDAMTSDRVYRKRKSLEEALAEIERNREKQFDPFLAKEAVNVLEGVYKKLSNEQA